MKHAFDYPTGISRPLETLEPPLTDPFTKLPFETLRRILLLAIDCDDACDIPRDQFTYDFFGRDVHLSSSRRRRVRAMARFCRTSILFRIVANTILYEHITIDTATYIFYITRALLRNIDLAKHCKSFTFILPEFIAYKYPLPQFVQSGQIQLHEYPFLNDFRNQVENEKQSSSLDIDIHNRDYKMYNILATLIWMFPNVEELSFPLPSKDDGLRRTTMLRTLFRELDKCGNGNSRFSRLKTLRIWAHRTDETFGPAKDFSVGQMLDRSKIPLIETLDEFDMSIKSEYRNGRREKELYIGNPGYVTAMHQPNLLLGYGSLEALTLDMCWDEHDLAVRRRHLQSSFERRKQNFHSGINAIHACILDNKTTLKQLRLRLNDAFIVDAYHSGETIKIDGIEELSQLALLEIDIGILLNRPLTSGHKQPKLNLPANLTALELRCTSPVHLEESSLPKILELIRQMLPELTESRKLGTVSVVLDEEMMDLVPSDIDSMYKAFSKEDIKFSIRTNRVDHYPQPLQRRRPRIE